MERRSAGLTPPGSCTWRTTGRTTGRTPGRTPRRTPGERGRGATSPVMSCSAYGAPIRRPHPARFVIAPARQRGAPPGGQPRPDRPPCARSGRGHAHGAGRHPQNGTSGHGRRVSRSVSLVQGSTSAPRALGEMGLRHAELGSKAARSGDEGQAEPAHAHGRHDPGRDGSVLWSSGAWMTGGSGASIGGKSDCPVMSRVPRPWVRKLNAQRVTTMIRLAKPIR